MGAFYADVAEAALRALDEAPRRQHRRASGHLSAQAQPRHDRQHPMRDCRRHASSIKLCPRGVPRCWPVHGADRALRDAFEDKLASPLTSPQPERRFAFLVVSMACGHNAEALSKRSVVSTAVAMFSRLSERHSRSKNTSSILPAAVYPACGAPAASG